MLWECWLGERGIERGRGKWGRERDGRRRRRWLGEGNSQSQLALLGGRMNRRGESGKSPALGFSSFNIVSNRSLNSLRGKRREITMLQF